MANIFRIEPENTGLVFNLFEPLLRKDLGSDIVLEGSPEGLAFHSLNSQSIALKSEFPAALFSSVPEEPRLMRFDRVRARKIITGLKQWSSGDDTLALKEENERLIIETSGGGSASIDLIDVGYEELHDFNNMHTPQGIENIGPDSLYNAVTGVEELVEGDRWKITFSDNGVKFHFGEEGTAHIKGNSPTISCDTDISRTIQGSYSITHLDPIKRFLNAPNLESVSANVGNGEKPPLLQLNFHYSKNPFVSLVFSPMKR